MCENIMIMIVALFLAFSHVKLCFSHLRVLNVFNPIITFHKDSSLHLIVIGSHFVVLCM
jgi:hypothetical protein